MPETSRSCRRRASTLSSPRRGAGGLAPRFEAACLGLRQPRRHLPGRLPRGGPVALRGRRAAGGLARGQPRRVDQDHRPTRAAPVPPGEPPRGRSPSHPREACHTLLLRPLCAFPRPRAQREPRRRLGPAPGPEPERPPGPFSSWSRTPGDPRGLSRARMYGLQGALHPATETDGRAGPSRPQAVRAMALFEEHRLTDVVGEPRQVAYDEVGGPLNRPELAMSLHSQTDFVIPDQTTRVARAAFPRGNAYMTMLGRARHALSRRGLRRSLCGRRRRSSGSSMRAAPESRGRSRKECAPVG